MNNLETKEHFSVLIPDGESPHALNVVRCLGQVKNVSIYVISNNARAPIRFSRYIDRFISYKDEEDNKRRLKTIQNIAKKLKADVILPVDCKTIELFSANIEILSKIAAIAPIPKAREFEISNNKWLLAEWLQNNDVPSPITRIYKAGNKIDEIVAGMAFPVLIKPVMGGDGIGIKIFDTPASLYSFFKQHIWSGEFIIQSFIHGYDIDCSVLCQEGKILAYTIQKAFIKSSRQFGPSPGIDFLYDHSTYEVVQDLVEKFNWSGVVHIDLRYDEHDKQVKVIEMNPRFWASILGSLCAGINFPYTTCLAGLGHHICKKEPDHKRYVNGSEAIKILLKRIVSKNRKEHYFDNSIIEFLLKDPLPTILDKYSKVWRKIVG